MQAEISPASARWRSIGILISISLTAYALASFWLSAPLTRVWSFLAVASLAAVVGQIGISPPSSLGPLGRAAPASRWRVTLGSGLFLMAVVFWAYATRSMYLDWAGSFDFTWLSWVGSAAAMGFGLELAWGRWEPTPGRRRLFWSVAVLALLAVAAWYRLWNLRDFPGNAGASQVEDLQTGQWGWSFVQGYRGRWEYLSHAWVPAIGMSLIGPSMLAMRLGLTAMSILKVIPIFLWLRFSVGNVGALIGTALFTFSHWDVVLSRIPHPIQILPALVFCLLAGPIRRGRPAAYVFLGLLCGFVLFEYVAYRPLAVLGPAGAVVLSLRDRSVGWTRRLLRPAITVALIGSMAVPLFFNRLEGKIWHEYFNGWNRAHEQAPYYDEKNTWQQSLRMRAERCYRIGTLFFFEGDSSPVKNVNGFPQVDPFTGGLMLIGIAFAVAHLFDPVIGLTLVGLLGTLAGTLILTGNWDVGRAGGAVAYVFAVTGFGAASIYEVMRRAWGRTGKVIAAVLLAIAVAGAAYMNTRHLFRYWNSRIVQVAMRSNLAYLSNWLRENTKPDEQAIGISPGQFNVLMPNDASFLRGREIAGHAAWDVESALRYWLDHPAPAVFFIFGNTGTKVLHDYFEWLTGVKLQFDADALQNGADIAHGHFDAPPEQLAEKLREKSCQGARVRFEVPHRDPAVPPFVIDKVLPVVDGTTWPAALRHYTFHSQQPLDKIRVTVDATLRIDKPGTYRIALAAVAGDTQLTVDGRLRASGSQHSIPVAFEAGDHTLHITGRFEPLTQEPQLRVLWTTPDTKGTEEEGELLPFYRVVAAEPGCAAPSS